MSISVGHVYVYDGGTGLIKIGRSATPKRRLRGIRTSVGHRQFESWVSQAVFDHEGLERAVHVELSRYRVAGEWFACSMHLAIETVKVLAAKYYSPDHPVAIEKMRQNDAKAERMIEQVKRFAAGQGERAASEAVDRLADIGAIAAELGRALSATVEYLVDEYGQLTSSYPELMLRVLVDARVTGLQAAIAMQWGRLLYAYELMGLHGDDLAEAIDMAKTAADARLGCSDAFTVDELQRFWIESLNPLP